MMLGFVRADLSLASETPVKLINELGTLHVRIIDRLRAHLLHLEHILLRHGRTALDLSGKEIFTAASKLVLRHLGCLLNYFSLNHVAGAAHSKCLLSS